MLFLAFATEAEFPRVEFEWLKFMSSFSWIQERPELRLGEFLGATRGR
jgi:hypothetical protein